MAARIATPATHNSAPTKPPRVAEVTAAAPSQPDSGLFSNGRSATNNSATTPTTTSTCAMLTARKSGPPGYRGQPR